MEQGPILALAGMTHEDRRAEYCRYVETGLARDDQEFEELLEDSPRAIGSREFPNRTIKKIERRIAKLS